MSEIYTTGEYLKNNPSWHEEDSPWKVKQINKILAKNSIKFTSLCEVGCGAGEILNQLSKHGDDKKYYGYDISPQAFDICSKKEKLNLSFFLKDIFEDDDAYFDIIMAIDVFEHVEDYIGFLRKLKHKANLKVFHIPLDLSVQSVLRASPILNVRENVGHIHYFTKDTALATLKDAGYEVIDHFFTAGSVELPNRPLKAKIMQLPRKLSYCLNKELAVRILGGYSLLVLAK